MEDFDEDSSSTDKDSDWVKRKNYTTIVYIILMAVLLKRLRLICANLVDRQSMLFFVGACILAGIFVAVIALLFSSYK